MFLFYVPETPNFSLAEAADDGLAADGEALRLFTDFDDVPDGEKEGRPVLVIDADAIGPPERATRREVEVTEVPPAAIRNVAPYRPPEVIRAGGGYVARTVDGANGSEANGGGADGTGDVAVLLIHRKGRWDLPKGKLDPGETIEECAQREVKEEVGIASLDLLRPLGTTQHGYVEDRRAEPVYAVKVTHWYLMQTPERSFEPERREGIRRVAWARWPVARRHVGYETLARHMDEVEADVRAAFGAGDGRRRRPAE